MTVWFIYAGILIYMETVFHFGCFGLQGFNPVFSLGLVALIAAVQAFIGGCFSEKGEKRASRIMLWLQYAVFAVQAVYYHIFKQPLQLRIMFESGADALTNYWREALTGLLQTLPLLVLLMLPILGLEALRKLGKWRYRPMHGIKKLRMGLIAWISLTYCICVIMIGNITQAAYAEEYSEYYDPETVMRNMGAIAMVQRDGFYEIQNLFDNLSRRREASRAVSGSSMADTGLSGADAVSVETVSGNTASAVEEDSAAEQNMRGAEEEPEIPEEAPETPEEEPEPDTSPNAWEIDLAKLAELSQDSKEEKWLADYIAGLTPTNRNEYTGMFEGYNLIFLTAEGFSTYAVREDLTPTLYKMVNSSFVFNNYYVPLWQTSTSDGEYVNCTGLIPDGQHSMKKSAVNDMYCCLPRFFSEEGVYCRAYHNNTLSYYDRYLSHPNLGYDFKAIKLGKGLSEEEWGDQLFTVETPDAWPGSDYEMMVGTVDEYINDDRFHVYYMTVSGHMNYDFKGNRMSSWNKEAVADLDMSENARAYIACNIELDKALEYLLDRLEQAGKLENTVICLSADHYPYGMTEEQYEELAGKDLSQDMDTYRNSLILWNAGMEEPVYVDKVCCSVDILPTLLNLFGFDFDSRMYAGRDIFSEAEGLVIFNDRSFVSDTVAYSRKQKTTTWKDALSEEEQEAYMSAAKQDVKDRYQFSAYILRNNYYNLIRQCITEESVY
ncbi:MAG: LTA synthase family protein [Butyrivibrio sp.]|nr:LTA synthase family protein [Acetatifactor muris]MCM1559918.1 LTA synthase family protein [Butyrivibrio sp.]